MGLIRLLGALAFISLFTIAIIGYMIDFGNDNDVAVSLSEDTELTKLKTSTDGSLVNFSKDINSSAKSFELSKIASGDETLETGASFKGTPKEVYSSARNIIKTGYKKLTGSSGSFAIFFTTFISFLGLMIFLYIWKLWKGGNPD